jgi:uncharacterized protein (DUF1800 family)
MTTTTRERPSTPDPASPPGRPTAPLAMPLAPAPHAVPAPAPALVLGTTMLAGCGGGSSSSPAPPPPAAGPTREEASRFLSQASLGADAAGIERVRTLGYSAWLDEQFALPRSTSRQDWLVAKGYDAVANKNSQAGSNNMLWKKLIDSPDTLRQRVTLALSEIIVVSVSGIASTPFKAFAAAAFMDILEAHAFGSYRSLLGQVSTSPAMGAYLSFRGNKKANPAVGSLPDENYAREVMQLFSIGLVQLDLDGSVKRTAGVPDETYTQADVSQMARVFTGWDLDTSIGSADTTDRVRRPMVQIASRHELGEKRFLGTVVPAGTDGVQSLALALDTLVAHPNIGPFIGRQLIQRLVTSNPSPGYIARVATAFNDNGQGEKGDLKAVVRAILLDDEARGAAGLADPAFGRLREPLHRFVQWARCFGLVSADDSWAVGDLSDPATRLGQSPMRSPSVFNFFRPGYVPPNSELGRQALTAPEFQITTESSVAGYVNFMQRCIGSGIAGMTADYTALLALVADPAALLAEINVLLAGGQLSAATLGALAPALQTVAITTAQGQLRRVYAALTLVMAAPEYLVLK